MTDLTVSKTILAQLGGNKFIAMTGAKHFLGSADTLRFQLPSARAAKGVKFVSIQLMPSDTYTMLFHNLKGVVVKSYEDVYCDQLQELFTTQTGLDTHL